MVCAFISLLMAMGGIGVFVWLGWKRVVEANPDAARVAVENIVVPLLLGRKEPKCEEETEPKSEENPEPNKVNGTWV